MYKINNRWYCIWVYRGRGSGGWGGCGCTSILEDDGELLLYWPLFLTFSDPIESLFMPNSILTLSDPLGPFLCPTRSYWPSLSAEKIGLSLLHLVPEIIWHKVWYIFSQISVIWHFWSNLYQLSLLFSILLTLFFIVIISFWPLIFTKP